MAQAQTAVATTGTPSNDGFIYLDSLVVQKKMVVDYADLVGDHNRIHTDPEYAKASGLEGPIAHGGLLIGLVSRFIFDEYGDGTKIAKASEIKFDNPLLVGDWAHFYVHEKKKLKRADLTLFILDVEVRGDHKTLVTLKDVKVFV